MSENLDLTPSFHFINGLLGIHSLPEAIVFRQLIR